MQRVLGVEVDGVVEHCYVFVVRDWHGEGVVVGLSHDGLLGDGGCATRMRRRSKRRKRD